MAAAVSWFIERRSESRGLVLRVAADRLADAAAAPPNSVAVGGFASASADGSRSG